MIVTRIGCFTIFLFKKYKYKMRGKTQSTQRDYLDSGFFPQASRLGRVGFNSEGTVFEFRQSTIFLNLSSILYRNPSRSV
jgi:hypothetical protein